MIEVDDLYRLRDVLLVVVISSFFVTLLWT